jgi:cytochrome P450
LLTSPKALAEVLVQKNYEFIKPKFFSQNLGRLLGLGILFAEGDEHKRQRKLLLPAFAFRHIKELYSTFWAKGAEVTEAMTKAIQAKPKGDEDPSIVDIHDWASRVTLDIIGIAGMGQDFNAVQEPRSDLAEAYRNVFQTSGAAKFLQLLSFFLPHKVLVNLPLKRNRVIVEARQVIRQTCFDLIEAKKEKMEKGGATGKDIISVALESGGFSSDNLVDQLMTFLAAVRPRFITFIYG